VNGSIGACECMSVRSIHRWINGPLSPRLPSFPQCFPFVCESPQRRPALAGCLLNESNGILEEMGLGRGHDCQLTGGKTQIRATN